MCVGLFLRPGYEGVHTLPRVPLTTCVPSVSSLRRFSGGVAVEGRGDSPVISRDSPIVRRAYSTEGAATGEELTNPPAGGSGNTSESLDHPPPPSSTAQQEVVQEAVQEAVQETQCQTEEDTGIQQTDMLPHPPSPDQEEALPPPPPLTTTSDVRVEPGNNGSVGIVRNSGSAGNGGNNENGGNSTNNAQTVVISRNSIRRRPTTQQQLYLSRNTLHHDLQLPEGYGETGDEGEAGDEDELDVSHTHAHTHTHTYVEQRTTAQGQVYFIHRATGVSTWHDPRFRQVTLATLGVPRPLCVDVCIHSGLIAGILR